MGDNPFEGMPLFGDLARMLGQQGPVAWDAARQMALSIATNGISEPNVDPIERMQLEQLARVADLHVSDVTGLSTSITGATLTVLPVNRSTWVLRSIDAYRPHLERLAAALARTPEADPDEPAEADEAMGAWLGGIMQMLNPMMLAMTSGSMLGHLAQRSFGQYDLPIPRPPSDELLLVVPNLDAFAAEWNLPAADLRLWICVHEIAHHAVLGVPHVRARLERLMDEFVSAFRTDSSAFEGRIGEIDPSSPDSLANLQQAFGDPEVLLGAIQSDEQRALLPQLDALVCVIVGYVDHVLDTVGDKLIASNGMLTEALRRRRVEAADADRFVERLFGLGLTQAHVDRGAAFIDGVVERAGEDGLRRLWSAERLLPTPAELDAPGLWLARIDLPDA
jgi:putative hydrolase